MQQNFKAKLQPLLEALEKQSPILYNQLEQEFGLSQTDDQDEEDYDAWMEYDETDIGIELEPELETDTTTIQ